MIGVPFYGRSFTLADPYKNAPGAPHLGNGIAGQYSGEPGTIGYNELCEKMVTEEWKIIWEGTQKAVYAYKGNQWVSFENPQSIAFKSQYVVDHGLAGLMVWSIESDDFRGVCGEKYPLLNEIFHHLNGNNSKPNSNTFSPTTVKIPPTPTVFSTSSLSTANVFR